MNPDEQVVLIRIYLGESDTFKGKPLYKHILEFLRKKQIDGATVFRGIAGYGKTSVIHTTSLLRMSSDLPIMIEVVDTKENLDAIKPELLEMMNDGLITEEKVYVVYFQGKTEDNDQP